MATSREGRGRRHASDRVLQPRARARSSDENAIYARALLERAEITEKYSVTQQISKNPWARMGADPQGRIELAIPYDGDRYFTRQARRDVAHGLETERSHERAVIGHLLLRDYSKTNLRQGLHLMDRHGSVPIEVPIGSGRPNDLDLLTSDQQACVAKYDFEPDMPGVFPAQLNIALYDPDSLDLPDPGSDLEGLNLRDVLGGGQVGDVVTKIRQQLNFRDELVLRIDVSLSLPARPGQRRLKPMVGRVAIGWPTITSLRTLSLRVGDDLPGPGRQVKLNDAPVNYNPVRECIEWENVRMLPVDGKPETPDEETAEDEAEAEEEEFTEGEIRHYRSLPMLLSVEQPGELFKQDILKATANVTIENYLLSGTTARIYDASGFYLKNPLKLTSKISVEAELTLDDAFATREFSPNQQLFFDETIPDEMRMADIRTALQDRGFTVQEVWSNQRDSQNGQVPDSVSWLHVAHRKVGPDDMVLWILAVGRRFETERETTRYGGGVINKTRLESGELRIFIRGQLPRDSRELTHEMNAFQRTLRERYDRVRQRN